MAVLFSDSTEKTEYYGKMLGEKLVPGNIVALFGDLGVGKTAFTRGLVAGVGITTDVYSPTFALVNEYCGNGKCVCHFDMYRINGWDDLYSTGYFDYVDTERILIIEWSENIESVLPENCIRVTIEKCQNDNERKLIISGEGIDENFGC